MTKSAAQGGRSPAFGDPYGITYLTLLCNAMWDLPLDSSGHEGVEVGRQKSLPMGFSISFGGLASTGN
jgi:hypothetical protein